MTSDDPRSAVFGRIRSITSNLKDKAPVPEYDPAVAESGPRLQGGDLWEVFRRNLDAVHGRAMTSVDELAGFLKQGGHTRGYCDPALFDAVGAPLERAGLAVETEYDRGRIDDYAFGITRATGAIAESGTIILDDRHTSRRLAALTPWVHVAVLDRTTIHRSMFDALTALGDSPNVIWCTGPSKTADVEGILIEGVHGPGEQIALVL